MKLESTKNVPLTMVSGQVDVTISVDKSEADELRAALKVVDRYNKFAFNSLKCDPRKSDWHMVSYRVKNNRVILSIQDGMAG